MTTIPIFIDDEHRDVTYHCTVTAWIDSDPGDRDTPPYSDFVIESVIVKHVEYFDGETSHAEKPTDADRIFADLLLNEDEVREAFEEHENALREQCEDHETALREEYWDAKRRERRERVGA